MYPLNMLILYKYNVVIVKGNYEETEKLFTFLHFEENKDKIFGFK